MIKLMVLLWRLPEVSSKAFRDYYEDHHAPLIQRLLPMHSDYRRNYPIGETVMFGERWADPCDSITELRFDDEAAYAAFCAAAADPEIIRRIRLDEENFLDSSKTVRFVVEEQISKSRAAGG